MVPTAVAGDTDEVISVADLDWRDNPSFDIDRWSEKVLDREDADTEWFDEGVDSIDVPFYEIDSVLCALEDFGPVELAAFHPSTGRAAVRRITVPVTTDTSRQCPAPETRFVYRRGESVAIAWCDAPGRMGQLMCVANDDGFCQQVLDGVWDLATGSSSTWRGQVIGFDPGARPGFRHLDIGEPAAPVGSLATSLRTNLIEPVVRFDEVRSWLKRRGMLLHGRPGTGKTWAFKWVASQVSGSATVIFATSASVSSAATMRAAFDMAADASPCLLVFEDLDIGAGNRMYSPDSFAELLNAMDGPGQSEGVFVGATTNCPEVLDPAITQRPGRFDATAEVDSPPESARRAVVEQLAAGLGIADAAEIDAVVRGTVGASMAEIHEIATMARLLVFASGSAPSLVAAMNELSGAASMSGANRKRPGFV